MIPLLSYALVGVTLTVIYLATEGAAVIRRGDSVLRVAGPAAVILTLWPLLVLIAVLRAPGAKP